MNPTAVQFQSAYAKLLCNNSVRVPNTANCVPQDDTTLVSINIPKKGSSHDDKVYEKECNIEKNIALNTQNTRKALGDISNQDNPVHGKEAVHQNSLQKRPDIVKIPSYYSEYHIRENLSNAYNISYHDYNKASSWIQTAYSEQVIAHVAGAVVYSIEKDVHCDRCMALLTGEMKTKSQLTVLKNRGGLRFAIDDVICICNIAERESLGDTSTV
ncbi:hypothetical protein QAD02_021457 [Eretmocerus hayati]|uniref:Uncharacterized protein n=1 Tax=Eretmocerus hayati TaxID=131215 RepID=A0ACC2PQT2_9HYME|nr:hypothetical protein QAD02_021457 [Eretmocerus hayati]